MRGIGWAARAGRCLLAVWCCLAGCLDGGHAHVLRSMLPVCRQAPAVNPGPANAARQAGEALTCQPDGGCCGVPTLPLQRGSKVCLQQVADHRGVPPHPQRYFLLSCGAAGPGLTAGVGLATAGITILCRAFSSTASAAAGGGKVAVHGRRVQLRPCLLQQLHLFCHNVGQVHIKPIHVAGQWQVPGAGAVPAACQQGRWGVRRAGAAFISQLPLRTLESSQVLCKPQTPASHSNPPRSTIWILQQPPAAASMCLRMECTRQSSSSSKHLPCGARAPEGARPIGDENRPQPVGGTCLTGAACWGLLGMGFSKFKPRGSGKSGLHAPERTMAAPRTKSGVSGVGSSTRPGSGRVTPHCMAASCCESRLEEDVQAWAASGLVRGNMRGSSGSGATPRRLQSQEEHAGGRRWFSAV